MSTDTRGVKVEPAQLQQIRIGQTTQAEVVSLLGKPSRLKQSQGQTEMNYQQQQFEHRHMGVIAPLTGGGTAIVSEVLAGKSRLQRENTTIVIGKDGKVADIKRSSEDGHYTGLLVRDDSPKAALTRVDEIQPGITTKEQVETLLGAPPMATMSVPGNTRQMRELWFGKTFGKTGQFKQLGVILSHDGIVDEVEQYYKGGRWFPKRVDADKIAQIKERQSNREAAESVLGLPITINRNVQGSFYTYYIKVDGAKEGVHIEYSDTGLITRLIRNPVPENL